MGAEQPLIWPPTVADKFRERGNPEVGDTCWIPYELSLKQNTSVLRDYVCRANSRPPTKY